MIRIAVASGKGGTGKTTVATSLALLLARKGSVHFLDCDVEAPNGALFLRPVIDVTGQVTRPVPVVDESVCDHCGDCSAFCRFHALATTARRLLIFPEICHGCGGCALVPVLTGAPAESAATLVQQYLDGKLVTGENACDH